MAERKQVNKYYPPDFNPQKHKNLDKYHNSHALRERAKKIDQGILVIRFEMPYDIWCGGCKIHIAMGVRYNAEKRKVGYYYSTPIYRFRMKCHLCENYFEIETDPKNVNYKIMFGAHRKNEKWDMAENEQVLTEDRQVVKKLASDAMFKLEHGVEDKKKLQKVAPTLSEIADIQSGWQDDYMQNRLLRDKFRKEKKELKAEALKDRALLDKSSLDIELVPETEEDRKLAALLKYKTVESFDDKQRKKRSEIQTQSIFVSPNTKKSPSPKASPSPSKTTEKASTSSSSLEKLTRQLDMAKKSNPGGFGIFEENGGKRKTPSIMSSLVVKRRKSGGSGEVTAARVRLAKVQNHKRSSGALQNIKQEDGRVDVEQEDENRIVETLGGETCDGNDINADDGHSSCLCRSEIPGSTNGPTCYSHLPEAEDKASDSHNPAVDGHVPTTEISSNCVTSVIIGTPVKDPPPPTISDVKVKELENPDIDIEQFGRDSVPTTDHNKTENYASANCDSPQQAQLDSGVSLVGDYAATSSDSE